MTRSARNFVGPVTFESVTGRPVHADIFEPGNALLHIRLAREAECIVVAPATADFMARAAQGRADDLLGAILLAATCPVMLSPAMNDHMWDHLQTRHNVAHARTIGYTVLEPETGPLAYGEGEGPGRLPDTDVIVAHLQRLLTPASPLAGRSVLVTAGATREPIDPVRFISNHSSGRMGIAVARAAWRRGATVTLIAGSVDVPLPAEIRTVRVGTTEEMARAVAAELPESDVLVMAAAPADFRPASSADSKLKKERGPSSIPLQPTVDVLQASREHRREGAIIVGFALETDDLVANARAKLQSKRLDLVVANRAGVAGEGFGADTNRVVIISADGEDELPLASKSDVAEQILDRVEVLLDGR